MVPAPEPCPFCGCEDYWIWDKAIPGGFAIACSNTQCAATGPISMVGIPDATRLWNRREPQPR